MTTEELKLLKDQVLFAHQRIERLTAENLEYRVLLQALMHAHPEPVRLAAVLENEKEQAIAQGLGYAVDDALLESLESAIGRALQQLHSLRR